MSEKTCPRCSRTLPLTRFGRNCQSVDGLHYYCKVCAAARQREWARAHPERVKESKRAYLQRVREQNEGKDPYAAP